ncbi:MAG: PepSY domain-containing protein [Pseudomonadota bacterium]
MASANHSTLYHRVWRWHFIAGLVIIPFAVILSITGGIYLFKPQVEMATERSVNGRAEGSASARLSMDDVIDIVLTAYPEATFRRLTLPRFEGDLTAEVELRMGQEDRLLWVHLPTGDILHDIPKDQRLMNVVKDIHGNLMAGNNGSYVVELMASWMIVLIITGAYLWWPRKTHWWRMFLPKFAAPSRRDFLKQLHGVSGAWMGGVIFIILLSGLPWTQVWGDGFKAVQKVMGWDGPGQEWVVTLQSSNQPILKDDGLDLWTTGGGEEAVPSLTSTPKADHSQGIPLQAILDQSQASVLPAPVEIQPPRGENGVWTIRSMTQNRPHRVTAHYDQWTGEEIMRIEFADHHPVKRLASYGIAFHEGALFGWVNQLVGVLATLAVVALSVTGGLMWWRRKPAHTLGVPPLPEDKKLSFTVIGLIGLLALFLPLVGLSLLLALLGEFIYHKMRSR